MPPALLACVLAACTTPAPDGAPPPPAAAPPGAHAVRVRLVFGAEADLDLYVTGPALETVYFANDRSADGGRLDADRRCETPGPRVETIVFPEAPAGDYRVGVDFPERCDGVDEVPYRLLVDTPDGEREIRGRIRFAQFDSRALQFRVDPRPGGKHPRPRLLAPSPARP